MLKVKGEIQVAKDKSISHRCAIFSSIANGKSVVKNFLMGEDCKATLNCMNKLGAKIDIYNDTLVINGTGIKTLKSPCDILNVGNSGTTARLLTGLLCGYDFSSTISGDSSLNSRPMNRIIEPLEKMGAEISSNQGFCPLTIKATKNLNGIEYTLPIASAQLKSAIILAALNANGATKIIEMKKSRDHTERILTAMGADINVSDNIITVSATGNLSPIELTIPGDISSASYFIVLTLLCKNSSLTIKNVGLNPTRIGILDILIKMGAKIRTANIKVIFGEIIGDIKVESSQLHGVVIEGDIIPRLIDEIPIIAVAAAMAEGQTIIKDAKELKVKESNRILTTTKMLNQAGVKTEIYDDGFKVYPSNNIKGGNYETFGDHRIAMSAQILSLLTEENSIIDNISCVNVSYPNFFQTLKEVIK